MPKRLLLWNTAFIAIRRNTSCHQNELSNIRIVKHELFIQSDFRYYFMLAIQKSNDATILTLREKCPNMELFLVRIQAEYRKIRTRNNSVFGHFSRSESYTEHHHGNNWYSKEMNQDGIRNDSIRRNIIA